MVEIGLKRIAHEATYRCPARCVFCYNCWKHDYREEEELRLAEFRAILEKLPSLESFTFTGGEPLLRDDLRGLFEAAKGKAPIG